MKLFFLRLLCPALLLAAGIHTARAQFYQNGRGPAGMRWHQIKSPDYKLVYPDYYRPTAISLAGFLDSIVPGVSHGFTKRPQRIPIILYTENLYSNGEVVWAPKRAELMTPAPAEDTHADLWMKQLLVHEYRHIAQISALRSGFTKVVSWVIGQGGTGVGLLCVPKWFFEGDATMAETQFSEFGRGLQPSFTVDMRALLADDPGKANMRMDRWVAGSYRMHIPDIYEYGYQLVAAGERHYGLGMWGGSVEYAGKYPILITPMRTFLKRRYGMKLTPFAKQTMAELRDYWAPFSAVPDNYRILTTAGRSYTTYNDPLAAPDGTIIATKKDYDTPIRFVTIDTTATDPGQREKLLRRIAPPSSRPILSGQTLYWTEYKPHPIWEYKNYSIVRSLDLQTGERNKYGMRESNYFVTPLSGGLMATVMPDKLGGSELVLRDSRFAELDRIHFDGMTTVHGMAWDEATGTLAFIALNEEGMYLHSTSVATRTDGRPGFGPLRELTNPSMVSLSGLRSDGGGYLYFSSIESGKDEIHRFDLRAGTENRLTTSRFGAYRPSASGEDNTLLMTTYTPQGYMVAAGSKIPENPADTIGWKRLPQNILNIPGPRWNQIPEVSSMSLADTVTEHSIKRYRKGLRLFNVHTWAPLTGDIDGALDERNLKLGFGATVFFQSPMSDSYGFATYGRLNKSNWLQGNWTYAGLPVLFTFNAEYGGGKQGIYIPANDYASGVELPADMKNYLKLSAEAALPLNLSGGNHSRLLQPAFTVTHYNSLLYNRDKGKFDKGYQKYDAMLWWSVNRHSSWRSILPRLGYAVRANVSGSFSNRFGTVYSLYGRGYLPGFMRNHTITLRAGGMYQSGSELNFTQKPLFPRGANNWWAAKRFGAGAVDYTFPLVYPDGGINGIIYFKRIWLNLFGDYSRGSYFAVGGTRNINHYSWGGDIAFDINIASSVTPFTVKVTLASPSDDNIYVGFGLSLNL